MGSWMVLWRGGAAGGGGRLRGGLQGLLPGRVLQRFEEQIIDEDWVIVGRRC